MFPRVPSGFILHNTPLWESRTFGCTVMTMLRRLAILVLLVSAKALANESYRDQPCKTPEVAPSCFQTHGRLTLGNGTPAVRLWPFHTHHLYGIYSNKYGFRHDGTTLDNESPEGLTLVRKYIPNTGGWTLYGDFDVCPLEPRISGHMQAACIASATHVAIPKE